MPFKLKSVGYAFYTGTLGSGKTLCAVGKIREYALAGRKIASNLDLYLSPMFGTKSKISYIRLPDKPTLFDLETIGRGSESDDKSQKGLIVLDELGTWFNCRTWNDKTRLPLIDWFIHARKLGWDIIFLVQSVDSVDNQLVNSLCQHLVVCKSTESIPVPFFGKIFKILGIDLLMPKFHVSKTYLGRTESDLNIDMTFYRAKDLYPCYDTDQQFNAFYPHGTYSVLPPYYLDNHGLIDYFKRKISELTIKDDSLKIDFSFKTVAFCLFAFILFGFGVSRTYSKFSNTPFSPVIPVSPVAQAAGIVYPPGAVPASSPKPGLKEASINSTAQDTKKPFPVSEPPPLSKVWRMSGVISNKKTNKYLLTAINSNGYTRFIESSVCVMDSHSQPECLVDGELITLFSGGDSDGKKDSSEKPKQQNDSLNIGFKS